MAVFEPREEGRLVFLDALRGLAILLVVGYHAYARWPDLYPYGSAFAEFPLFRFGWIGVYLFFLISGFVIEMTLVRCRGFGDFAARRWLRLFPAMLLASALIYLSAPAFPERPHGVPDLRDALPGLTLIDVNWWAAWTGVPLTDFEGAFWSLYVEVKFYAMFGALYFLVGETTALIGLAVVAVAGSRLFGHLGETNAVFSAIHHAGLTLGGRYMGWFLVGALCRRATMARSWRAWLLVALALPLALGWFKGPNLIPTLSALALFVAAVNWPPLQRALQRPALLFFGFVSYPLYLIHENLLAASVIKLGATGGVLALLSPVPGFAVLTALAFVIAWSEPRLRAVLSGGRFAKLRDAR